MAKKSGRGPKEARHVRLYEYLARSQAWRRLSSNARSAWLEIGLIYNGCNNGKLAVSCRMLGEGMGVGKDAASRAILELENAGFLKRVKASSFSQKKHAAEYRLTHLRCDVTGEAPTHDYRRSERPELSVAVAAGLCDCKPQEIREATERGEITFRDVNGKRLCDREGVLAYQQRKRANGGTHAHGE